MNKSGKLTKINLFSPLKQCDLFDGANQVLEHNKEGKTANGSHYFN